MKLWTGIALLASVLPAFAQTVTRETPADLPPTVLARQWIDQDPAVQEARSALQSANHAAAMLNAGTHEWTTRVTVQRRNYDAGGGNSREWNAALERGIRINGKAELDQHLGETELAIAQARVGEAIHESARALLDLWLDGVSASQAAALYEKQHAFARENLRAVEVRQRAGDASALDVGVARTDAADVERQASQAVTLLAKARSKLRVRFPGAQLPSRPLGDPVLPAEDEAQWLAIVLEASDPLRIAQGQLRRAELTASRMSADRVPDPTVGAFAASEAFGRERIVGVSISIPLGGTYRSERALQAHKDVDAARAAVDRQRRELEAGVAETYADATGNTARWRLAEQGAAAAADNAKLTQRAYSLGEADLQALLLARRQSLEASRAALEARVEALRANFRLLVDAHQIWDLSVE